MASLTRPAPHARRDRIGSAIAVAAVHVVLGAALILGLNPDYRRAATSALKTFDVIAPPPPPEVREPKPKQGRKEGAAAPPAQKAKPAPVVAPKVEIPRPPPPIVAAPVASTGNQPRSGATPLPGPGTGAGGEGMGTGSGGSGDGDGDGGVASHSRHIRGRIRDSDYPDGAADARAGGVVTVEFVVEVDGRPRDCRIVESSGRRDLDITTCELIERRFRFEPARDRSGRKVPEINGWEQTWWLEERD